MGFNLSGSGSYSWLIRVLMAVGMVAVTVGWLLVVGRMPRWARRGVPAGISTVLAFLAGTLTNVYTQGWNLPVGVGLAVLVVVWVGWEVRQAAGRAVAASGSSAAEAFSGEAPGRKSVVPRQLPGAAGRLAGRQVELGALAAVLGRSSGRVGGAAAIVVISGTAGVGKTTLAVYWAHRVADRFPDGQLYVNLRGFDPTGAVLDPADAVRRFLDALGVPAKALPVDLDGQVGLYRSLLADRRVLIVLDNARDAAQVRPLLPGAASCLVVVTSRSQLTGLLAGHGAQPINLDLLTVGEARDLLAHRLGPDRVDADPDTVAEIIARCARLPLALAVVAARGATHPNLPLTALAGELRDARDRLDVLVGEDPATDIRAVLSWSYDALTPQAARLLRLLGLHPGPDLSTPAAASLAALSTPRVRTLLAELTRANLIVEHATDRYTLHDLLRAYATDLADALDPDQQRQAAAHRILDHYLHTAALAARLVAPHRDPIEPGPAQPGVIAEHLADQRQAMTWFITEHPVLMATVDRSAAGGFDTHTWQLACVLYDFLDRHAHWHDLAVAGYAAVAAANRLADPTAQARAYLTLAIAHTRLGRYDEAHIQFQDALDVTRRTGDQTGQAHTYNGLVQLWGHQGRHAEGLALSERAYELYRAVGHRHGQAMALNNIGWAHALLGDHEQGIVYCQQALTQLQDLGNRYGQAATWDSLGYAHHHLGHHTQAVTCYQHALALSEDLGDRYYTAVGLTGLGDALHAAGDHKAAYRSWQQALTNLDHLNHVGNPEADQLRTRLATLTPPTARLRRKQRTTTTPAG
jgi:tetratricopeptide (TPR) repeat protein